jgi:DNA-binding SARP family transcriptional activator
LAIPEGGQRILAFIALHEGRRVDRRQLAGTLWPLGSDERAAGNLRSALWRIGRAGTGLVRSEQTRVALCQDLLVDLHLVTAWAERLLSGRHRSSDLDVLPLDLARLELLPGWYEDWVLTERERTRQRLLHAVEALSGALRAAGRHAEAVDAALAAVTADPLRESSQRMLIQAHLAEGNRVEARRAYLRYRSLLRQELGAEPQPALTNLLIENPRRDRPVPSRVPAQGRT